MMIIKSVLWITIFPCSKYMWFCTKIWYELSDVWWHSRTCRFAPNKRKKGYWPELYFQLFHMLINVRYKLKSLTFTCVVVKIIVLKLKLFTWTPVKSCSVADTISNLPLHSSPTTNNNTIITRASCINWC